MTRWLAAAKAASAISEGKVGQGASDKIDIIDKNTPEQFSSILSEEGKVNTPAPSPQPQTDAEAYVDALRLHGPMSYGMAARRLGWGATRAGQAETLLIAARLITFNTHGRAYLIA